MTAQSGAAIPPMLVFPRGIIIKGSMSVCVWGRGGCCLRHVTYLTPFHKKMLGTVDTLDIVLMCVHEIKS